MKNPYNTEPMTLLDVIKTGYLQQVRFLVEQGVNLDQRDTERRTALMLCAFVEPEQWGIGICRLLIENGANLVCKDKYGLNAFHYAVIYERVELVQVYLKAIDFDLNQGDALGNTALHYAVRADNSIITGLIAQVYVKYKISFEKENEGGCTPLQEAYRLNNMKCVRVLENAFAMCGNQHVDTHIALKTNGYHHEDSVSRGSSGKFKRSLPLSDTSSRQSSKGNLNTNGNCIHVYVKSPTHYSYDMKRIQNQRRDQFDEIRPYEKNLKKLIRCASASDIRNNPEYLFHLELFNSSSPTQLKQGVPKHGTRAKSAFVRQSVVANESLQPRLTWRTEFGKLYNRYKYQCTSSYRDSATTNETHSLPPLAKPVTPVMRLTQEHIFDEDKGEKPSGKWGLFNGINTDEGLSKSMHFLHKTVSRKN